MTEQVALVKCSTYQPDEVSAALAGLSSLLAASMPWPQGKKVLVKPNLLLPKSPESAALTHPALVEEIVRKLQSLNCEVIIGDSPGGPVLASLQNTVYKVSGMAAVAKNTGCRLLTEMVPASVTYPEGKILKRLEVVQAMTEADLIVNVSKLKTHGLTLLSGAVKNMFGGVPGLKKAEYHLRMPQVPDFCQAMTDICCYFAPSINIMDAVIGMEGDGPSGGNPRQAGCLLASANPFALDLAAAALIGIEPPEKAPILKVALERGLTPPLADLKILGEDLAVFCQKDWKKPKITTGQRSPALFSRFIQRYPLFLADNCNGCGICAKSCPPKVITMREQRPTVDLSKCIHCFCCQELCPRQAVKIKKPWLSRILAK